MKRQLAIGLSFTLISTCVMAQPLFQDGFESGNKLYSENGFSWANDGTNPKVVTANSRTGQHSLEFTFEGRADGEYAWSEQRFDLGGNYSELWIKYDLYVPTNYYHRNDGGTTNNKGIVTLWNGSYNSPTQFLGFEQWATSDGSSSLTYHPIVGSSDRGHTRTNTLFVDRSKDLGKWIEFIVHIKLASPSNNDGIIRVWKHTEGYDREQIVNVTNLNNYTPTANYFSTGYLLGWANSGFSETTKMYIDNIVFSPNPISLKQPNPPSSLQLEN